jgi:hypothetical protein
MRPCCCRWCCRWPSCSLSHDRKITLLIVSKRHPASFPMHDLGGPAVQRFAKERCREPAAIDAFVATVMVAACERARIGPVGECCAMD